MIGNIKDLEKKQVTHQDSKNAGMKVLVSPNEGCEGYFMRVVEIEEAGYTPKHSHPWPHINYMLEGEGQLLLDGKYQDVKPGSYAYVPASEIHQFRNTGKSTFKFICIVPEEGHK